MSALPIPERPPLADHGSGRGPRYNLLLRALYLLVLIFGFLVAIELLGKSIRGLGEAGILGGTEGEALFSGVHNPFAGLAIGVLFTVLVQSSSTTTATIVAVVGSGALSVEHAVPMIMGANIGTTVTNTLVSVGHVRRSAEFRRAFACATIHDFFNLMVVAVMLPLELMTGALSTAAAKLTDVFAGTSGVAGSGPIKSSIKSVFKSIQGAVEAVGIEGSWHHATCLLLGLLLTFFCLHQITSNMRRVLAGNIEVAMNRALESSGLVGIGVGVAVTVSVQSSSITTSLLVPMCAAGVMTLENAFAISMGANIGTTVTAVLASLAQDNPEALTIALVHVLFNVGGVCLIYPIKFARQLPLAASRGLAAAAARNRWWVLIYVITVFVLVPFMGWTFWKGAS